MAVQVDFAIARFDDGVLVLALEPPEPVGGWQVQFTQWRRFPYNTSGAPVSGLITKSCASGYGGGQSGITVTNSGAGIFSITLFATDISGEIDQGNYAYRVERLDSGYRSVLSEGFRQMN